jgi:hypothetical protein
VKSRIDELLAEARRAKQRPGSYGLLPDIITILEKIQDRLESNNPDPKTLIRGASALGRVVTDDYSFSESPLGTKLLDLVSAIVSEYDST